MHIQKEPESTLVWQSQGGGKENLLKYLDFHHHNLMRMHCGGCALHFLGTIKKMILAMQKQLPTLETNLTNLAQVA